MEKAVAGERQEGAWPKKDIFINSGLVILCGFLLWEVYDYPDMARTFPSLVLIMIMLVALLDASVKILARQPVRGKEGTAEREEEATPHTLKVYYTVFLMILFMACLLFLGVVVGVAVFVFFASWTLGYKRLLILAPTSVLISGFVYVIFSVIMKSLLPKGIIVKLFLG